MKLSELLKILHTYIGTEKSQFEFMQYWVTLIMREPISDKEIEEDEQEKYYPFSNSNTSKNTKDYISKKYSGTRDLTKAEASKIKGHFDAKNLDYEFDSLEMAARQKLVYELSTYGISATQMDVQSVFAHLFEIAIDELSVGNVTFEIPSNLKIASGIQQVKNSIIEDSKNLPVSVLEKIQEYLLDPGTWESADSLCNIKYYIYNPDYTIKYLDDWNDSRDGYEYYLFSQYDPTPHWTEIQIKYRETVLFSTQGAFLDGGRYLTPCPLWSFIYPNNESEAIAYKYFIKGSMEFAIHRFFYDEENDDERFAHDRLLKYVLVFESDTEKVLFEKYSQMQWTYKERYLSCLVIHSIYGISQDAKEHYEMQIKNVFILQKMLDEMRSRKCE